MYLFVSSYFFSFEHDFNYNYALKGYSCILDELVLSANDSQLKEDEIFKVNPIFRISHNKKAVIVCRIKISSIETLLKIFNELGIEPGNVESLDVSICGLNDLNGLEKFRNIRYLDISKNNFTSFPSFSYFPFLTEILYNNNKLSKKEELKIKKYLANIDLSKLQPYDFKNDTEYEKFLNTNYQEAEKLYDLKKYQEAVVKYQEVVNAFEYHNNDIIHLSLRDKVDSEILQYKMLYFSLYNIACCYSLLENFDKTKEFLNYALKAGYPYLEYILSDKDLKSYFEKVPDSKRILIDVYNAGNSNNVIECKSLRYARGPSCSIFSFSSDSNSVIQHRITDSFNQDYSYGYYSVKNYFIVCNFFKHTFLDNKGFVVGIGIKEEDCEKKVEDINMTVILPFYLIENVKTYYDWPSLSYVFD